jgi:very-short-patch-repair endonuclease
MTFDKKAYNKLYNQRPEIKAYMKAYHQRPEVKAHKKEYMKSHKEFTEQTKRVYKNKGKTYEDIFGIEKAKFIKEKISNTNKGRTLSNETKEKMSISKLGHPSYLKHQTKEAKLKISKALKGHYVSEITRKKFSKIHKGKHLSKEAKEKMSKAKLGKPLSEEHKNNISKSLKGKRLGYIPPEAQKLKQSLTMRNKWATDPNLRKKVFAKRDKSSLEIKFEGICQKHNLPYKFVGNGDFFIERKCPDFINCNGEKIAIEVYCTKHKRRFKKIPEWQWKQERTAIFNKYGWKIIFFNELQVNEKDVLTTLRGDFNG